MIHSSFDSVAQFLHRKTEQAKAQTLGLMGPRWGRVFFAGLSLVVAVGVLFLVVVVVDTIFEFGLFQWIYAGSDAQMPSP